ncbi:hypothetical protein L596_021485 [Steinernema carpocapsae]|uniref:Uncharacterized protein n=1 Tax=Steinernema carpocapsae TaxID=34508 RepID=A0A4U5MIV8_STECR|nr:hypothetical protein L596_021485 [Steinernema carpocapsae]
MLATVHNCVNTATFTHEYDITDPCQDLTFTLRFSFTIEHSYQLCPLFLILLIYFYRHNPEFLGYTLTLLTITLVGIHVFLVYMVNFKRKHVELLRLIAAYDRIIA